MHFNTGERAKSRRNGGMEKRNEGKERDGKEGMESLKGGRRKGERQGGKEKWKKQSKEDD